MGKIAPENRTKKNIKKILPFRLKTDKKDRQRLAGNRVGLGGHTCTHDKRRFRPRSVAIAKAVFCALRLLEEDMSQTPVGGRWLTRAARTGRTAPSVWCRSSNIAKQIVARLLAGPALIDTTAPSVPLIRHEKSRRADIGVTDQARDHLGAGVVVAFSCLGVVCTQRVRRESAKKGQSVFLGGGREAGGPALCFWVG
jgi:hypothetical protein